MSAQEEYLLSVLRGRPGLIPGALRLGLAALAPVYCAGLEAYLLPYRLGLRKRYRLGCPVISIGNLTTGGTGKTPMTQWLCCRLQAQGQRIAILSRGYGGQNERGSAVVSDGATTYLTAREAGDEAYLLARTLPGAAVLVGKDRRVTGRRAVAEFAPDVILLDDGLQFWQLHRDLDIALLNALAPFDNGWTFPRGLLREPPSHLRRAGIVVLTNAQLAGEEAVATLRARVDRIAPGKPVFSANLVPTSLRAIGNAAQNAAFPLDWLRGRRIAALGALGHPAGFEALLSEIGGEVAARARFRDHYALTEADLESVFAEARAAGAEAVITTEKDAVKLPPLPDSLPLLSLQVELQIDGAGEFLRRVHQAIETYGTGQSAQNR